jgi:hypothetical protein
MATANPPTGIDLIRRIGDIVVSVDVLRSRFDRNTPNRKKLDDLRDELDVLQRKLVRNGIENATPEFARLTASLATRNTALKTTIDDVAKVAETLQSLVRIVNIIERIVALTG